MNPIQKAYQHIQMDNQSKKEVLQDILSSHPKPKRINDRYKMITLSCCICIAFICFILFHIFTPFYIINYFLFYPIKLIKIIIIKKIGYE